MARPQRTASDTSNRFEVKRLTPERLAYMPISSILTEEDAINLAAWLVALTRNGRDRLADVLRQIDPT